jgi:hypothetical protein
VASAPLLAVARCFGRFGARRGARAPPPPACDLCAVLHGFALWPSDGPVGFLPLHAPLHPLSRGRSFVIRQQAVREASGPYPERDGSSCDCRQAQLFAAATCVREAPAFWGNPPAVWGMTGLRPTARLAFGLRAFPHTDPGRLHRHLCALQRRQLVRSSPVSMPNLQGS